MAMRIIFLLETGQAGFFLGRRITLPHRHGGPDHWRMAPASGPSLARSSRSSTALCHSRTNMSRLIRKSVSRSASVLAVLGTFMVLITLTNPSATPMAAALLLVGVILIAIATFAGL